MNFVGLKLWKLYFDGSWHKNGVKIGVLIISPNDEPTKFMFELKYECSNNKVEYEALILGLKILLSRKTKNVEIVRDSLLIVKQVASEYRCKSPNLIKYLAIVARLSYEFDKVIIRHVPQDQSWEANEIAQIASKYK